MSVGDRSSRGNTRKLKELLHKSDNRICADCSAPDPKWATAVSAQVYCMSRCHRGGPFVPSGTTLPISQSCCQSHPSMQCLHKFMLDESANIGVFICVKCCGVHRSLGTHISKVLSVTLDEWSDEEIESMMEVGGNSYANSIYEAFLPENYPKPKPDSNSEERSKFIRSKYELQEFLKPSLRIVSTKSSYKSCDSGKDKDYSSDADNSAGMVEFIGILNTKVIRGTNLAVRDLRSSDPYVVLTLGHQKAQTTVKNSNLNPVWNEELKLSVPESYGPLKLQVFDHDVISSDDLMGEAEVDLQPMLTAANAFGDPELLSDMQIGKWLKSHDNALMEDSAINIIDGKVKQNVSLKLQNVESGEIELELEWFPLN